MTKKPKKGVMKAPQKDDSKSRIIGEQRKEIRKLVKLNKKLTHQVYDLNKVLERNIRRIEELSRLYSVEELLNIDLLVDTPIVDVNWDDEELDEETLDAIVRGDLNEKK